jgi:hypothetical protein
MNPTYITWRNMRRRCTNPSDSSWHHYGGRGIAVCEQRSTYKGFLRDMGEKPSGLTLERIDTDGNYCPENCKWVSMRQNLNNRRNTLRINREPLTEVAERTGIKADTLRARLKRSVADERILQGNLKAPRPAAHGTRKRYERDGCRCDACRGTNAARARAYRAQLVADRLNGVER